MEDRSKGSKSGSYLPSDESRLTNKETSFWGTQSTNVLMVFSLITVFIAIPVGWIMNVVTIPIIVSILMVLLTTYPYLSKSKVQAGRLSAPELQHDSLMLETNDELEELPSSVPQIKHKLHDLKVQCTTSKETSTESLEPSDLLLPLREMSKNRACMLRKCELGTRKPGKQEKVIMLVGATGAGKTTLINGMVNYILGVEWEDQFRFKMVLDEDEKKLRTQAVSQTQWITAYTMHHESYFKIPFTLTIIDTPGFGDTRGIEHDKKTMKQISEFFHTKGDGGIDHITAIGIVVPSSAARLTHTQKFIFDAVLSLFGKDVEQNIFLMITFSDGKVPPVLDAITEAGIPHRKYFKFNNSALFAKSSTNDNDADDDTGFDSMFWKMGSKSFEKFFVHAETMPNKSLQLTKDVLDERMSLETYVEGIHVQLEAGLNKLEQYKTEVAILKKHETDIDLNKNFTYEVTEDTAVKVEIPNGRHTTTCLKCNFTCHATCSRGDDSDKMKCCVMKNGYCTVCPSRCHWENHKNMPYRIKIQRQTKTKTADDLKKRYEKAVGEKLSAQALIDQVSQDFTAVQINVIFLTDQIRKSLVRLDEIALRPNPMTALEYIDILIESEQKEHKDGWKERVKQLQAARTQAETLYNLADESYDPFAQYGEAHRELMKEGGDRIKALRKLQDKLVSGGGKIFKAVCTLLGTGSSDNSPESYSN